MKEKIKIPIFTKKSEFCEVSSDVPVETLVPGQAITLNELVSRFEKGQRLNISDNPTNVMYRTEEEAEANSERFEDAPPDGIHDITDVEAHYRAHQSRKKEFDAQQKEKRSKQAKPAEAPQDPTPPTSPSEPQG